MLILHLECLPIWVVSFPHPQHVYSLRWAVLASPFIYIHECNFSAVVVCWWKATPSTLVPPPTREASTLSLHSCVGFRSLSTCVQKKKEKNIYVRSYWLIRGRSCLYPQYSINWCYLIWASTPSVVPLLLCSNNWLTWFTSLKLWSCENNMNINDIHIM